MEVISPKFKGAKDDLVDLLRERTELHFNFLAALVQYNMATNGTVCANLIEDI